MMRSGNDMDLMNDRVYPEQEVQRWLRECAGVQPGTRAWKALLRGNSDVTYGKDRYLFRRVSETHYRVVRANAEEVKEVVRILNEASRSAFPAHSVILKALLYGAFILVVTAIVADVWMR